MNNSYHFDLQFRRLSIASSGSVPPPPASLSDGMMSFTSSPETRVFEYDCSRFEAMTPAPSFSFTPERRRSGLSRSRCVDNLSSLGESFSSQTSEGSASSRDVAPPCANAGWGYFVDTPSR